MLQILLAALALFAAPVSATPAPAPAAVQSETSAEAFAQALARWKVEAATSGKDAELAAAIDELWRDAETAAAARPKDAALAGQLAEVSAARTKFRLERGLERDENGVQASPEVSEVAPAEDQIIAHAVGGYLKKGEEALILELGARAVPHVVEVARRMGPEDADGVPAFALATLARLDAPMALDVCWELAQQESFLVRKRVVDVASQAFSFEGVWNVTADGVGEPRKPEWARLIELLLAEPAIDPNKFRELFSSCAKHGYAPPHVIATLMRTDSAYWPTSNPVPAGARSLFVAGLDHRYEAVRLNCARHVAGFPDPTPLFALHSDPSASVRSTVARNLGKRDAFLWPENQVGVQLEPVPSPAWWAALRALLDDEVESVRQMARGAAYRHASARPEEFLAVAAELERVDAKADALSLLAQSTSAPAVVGVAFGDAELFAETKQFQSFVSNVASREYDTELGRAVASALLEGLENTADREVWVVAFQPYPRSYQQPRRTHWIEWLTDLDRVRVMRGLALRAPDLAWNMARSPIQERDPAPWRALVLDPAEPAFLRMCAAGWSLGNQPPEPPHLAAVTRAFAEGLGVGLAPEGETTSAPLATHVARVDHAASWMSHLDQRLFESGTPAFTFSKALFRDPDVPDRVLQLLDLETRHGTPAEGAEVAQAVLARFPASGWPTPRAQELFRDVLRLAPGLPAEQRIAVIGTALQLGSQYQMEALAAAAEARDPELLEALRRAAFEQHIAPNLVAKAASSFLSDEAAKLILDLAAGASVAEQRAEILASLDQVLAYQEAKTSWEHRNTAAARAQALAELVALADDESLPEVQRAAALRGLGLIGAVEELPRLVRALGSPSEALRQAAQEALERLNVPAPK